MGLTLKRRAIDGRLVDATKDIVRQRCKAVLIAGPTASGKSALALALAERWNGTVINADSMQVYRDLRILTARPTSEDEARAPHRLYGHVDAAERHSAGRWIADAAAALREAEAERRLPIIVGGTGLYLRLLTAGLARIPPIPEKLRAALRERLAREGTAALFAELAPRDPAGAQRLHPGDTTRILRALEVLHATGRPLSVWQEDNAPPLLAVETCVRVFLAPDRQALRVRIDERFARMMQEGALEEVRALAARALSPTLPAMTAHGVPWLIRHLRGEITREEAIAGAQADTRRYAKRQFTWFRNQMPGWTWVAPEDAFAYVDAELQARG